MRRVCFEENEKSAYFSEGIFPAAYVTPDPVDPNAPQTNAPEPPAPEPAPEPESQGEMAEVIAPFNATATNQLSVGFITDATQH